MRTEETVREALILSILLLDVYVFHRTPEMGVLLKYRHLSKLSDDELVSTAMDLWGESEIDKGESPRPLPDTLRRGNPL